MRTLNGSRVLITGAAAGIGRSMAHRFAVEGAHLVLTDVDQARLEATAEELRPLGRRVSAHRLDVTDPDQVLAVRDAVHAEGGPIDVLVNNAGVVHGGAFLDVPLDAHLRTMQVNALAPLRMTHAFLPDLLDRPDAHLVNIASAAGYLAVPNGTTYAASKWAILGFSESIAAELQRQGRRNVHVTAVCPSYVTTGMFAGVRAPRLTPWLSADGLADQIVRAVLHNRTHLRTPFMVKTVPALKGLLPEAAFAVITDVLGVNSSMQTWQGHVGQPAAEPAPAAG